MNQNRHSRRRFLSGGLLALSVAVISAGCGGGGGGVASAPPPVPRAVTTRAILRGSQQNPAVVSNGSGTATLTSSADGTSLAVNVQTFNLNLANVTMAHIHAGRPGENGPIIFNLFDSAQGAFTGSIVRTLTAANLVSQSSVGITTFALAIAAINNGRAYLNIHTTANPNGEIRGQVGPVKLAFALNGASQVQPVTTTAVGSGLLELGEQQEFIKVTVASENLTGVTMSHIHRGARGVNGPIILNIATGATSGNTAKVFTDTSVGGASAYADILNDILSGNVYLNVHTSNFPNGEIRGQVGAERFTAQIADTNLANPIIIGVVESVLDIKRDALSFNLQTVQQTNVTSVEIRYGASDSTEVNSPTLFTIYSQGQGGFTNNQAKVLTAAELTPTTSVPNFAAFVTALRAGNVHIIIKRTPTPTKPLRGQFVVQP